MGTTEVHLARSGLTSTLELRVAALRQQHRRSGSVVVNCVHHFEKDKIALYDFRERRRGWNSCMI